MSRELSLTFDDGPDATWTPRVLDELGRRGARASFFLIAERLRELPQLARSLLEAGHEVALHCDRHIRHCDLSEAEIEADTLTALASFAEAGLHPMRWRTPWGICTPASVRVAERHGLELVHWSIDTHDWRGDSVAEMLASAAQELRGAAHENEHEMLVLMHDGLGPGALRDGCANTVELIEPLCVLAAEHELSTSER